MKKSCLSCGLVVPTAKEVKMYWVVDQFARAVAASVHCICVVHRFPLNKNTFCPMNFNKLAFSCCCFLFMGLLLCFSSIPIVPICLSPWYSEAGKYQHKLYLWIKQIPALVVSPNQANTSASCTSESSKYQRKLYHTLLSNMVLFSVYMHPWVSYF